MRVSAPMNQFLEDEFVTSTSENMQSVAKKNGRPRKTRTQFTEPLLKTTQDEMRQPRMTNLHNALNKSKSSAPSPEAVGFPRNAPSLASTPVEKSRLIDDGLMHFEASQAGYLERHARGETSHTLHVWWARRPHSAMRALVFATLCKRTDQESLRLLSSLVSSAAGESKVLDKCEQMLLDQYERRPRVLDMFGGGGTIPVEAVNLGAEVASSDVNELSVFIQRCHLEYASPKAATELKKVIADSGHAVLTRLREKTSRLYPLRDKAITEHTKPGPITYLWSYLTCCENCGYKYHLTKRPWLSKKGGKSIRLIFDNKRATQTVTIENNYEDEANSPERGSGFNCPKCGHQARNPSIKNCSDEIVALVLKNKRTGKTFISPTENARPSWSEIRAFETEVIQRQGGKIPDTALPRWSGIVNPALYGIDTHADFLNPRQRAVLAALIDELTYEHEILLTRMPVDSAKFVTGILSGLIDQMVDWNCRLSMWIPQNEQVGRAFCGPGVAMLWDYAETDPLLDGPGNLWSKLDRIVAGVDSLLLRRGNASVHLACAQNLPFRDSTFDAIVTDPPYYDNIYYNVLADFFYSWKRILLERIDPDLFSAPGTANFGQRELVASKIRSGGAKEAHKDYCERLAIALDEAARVLTDDGVLTFVYAHASVGGWMALIHAFRSARLLVTSAQPLSIERKARPRAMTSEAINTCIAFVARKFSQKKSILDAEHLLQDFRAIVAGGFADGLESAGWSAGDAAIALFAQGVGLLAGLSPAAGHDDSAILQEMETEVRKRYPDFRVKRRASL